MTLAEGQPSNPQGASGVELEDDGNACVARIDVTLIAPLNIILIAFVSLSASVGWLGLFIERRNRRFLDGFKRVHVGMNRAQVQQIMGDSTELFVVQDGTGKVAAEGWRELWIVVRV